MTRPLRSIFILFIIMIGFLFLYKKPLSPSDMRQNVMIGGALVEVEFARTAEEHARGLMYRANLAENAGMLFVFSKAQEQTFWNRNTLIPLDIVWIRAGTVVGISGLHAIGDGLQTVTSPEPVDRVLEVNRGWAEKNHITAGTTVRY